MKGFIDFGLTEAKKTNFDIKTLGGLKKYYVLYTKYLVAQKRAQDQMNQKKAQEEQERLVASYDVYRHEGLREFVRRFQQARLKRLRLSAGRARISPSWLKDYFQLDTRASEPGACGETQNFVF